MPAKIFSDEQTAISENVLAEYQGMSGKDKVQEKEAIIAQVIEQVTMVQHQNDVQAMKKLQNSVKNWLNNQSREMSNKEEYFCKTNRFLVFISENAAKIKE
ncbi:hypothetical protein PAXRUDRAFT_18408 [Paxillus rubicundulus Ve08.2h10]|uniref:Uncharacterized protein n=1 Tax=Paxillus rubicundulus Ve08.2h10 TaxID=930991 RepID=A0A0D0BY95_9AGAM|nr:hypothetical protein PAXRUDRAFT_18408 [Paxillus rubicundulus Ve08.2h10]